MTRAADVSAIGCSTLVARVASPPTASGPRDRLTAAELLASGSTGDGPIHNDYFMPLGPTAPARHSLRGTLAIAASSMSSAYQGCRGLADPTPAGTIDFFTQGEHLVPVVRGADDIVVVVAGGDGRHSAWLAGWGVTRVVTQEITATL